MITSYSRPRDSKEFYFKLNNALNLLDDSAASSTYKFAGLYAIYKDEKCYYVGQSQNLSSRLATHLTGAYRAADKVDLFLVSSLGFDDFYDRCKDSRREILEINESVLMDRLKPIENILQPGRAEFPDECLIYPLCSDEEMICSASIYLKKRDLTLVDSEPTSILNIDPRSFDYSVLQSFYRLKGVEGGES